MNKITLICPYFGQKFPTTFPILVKTMINNPNIKFIIPTNLIYNLTDISDNILFIKSDLSLLNTQIDKILGYHARLHSPYKLVDFKPMYGELFSEYIKGSDWWGYFDSDIIFGNISEFLTDELLNNYDRIFALGHLTLFRNEKTINSLWNNNFNLPEVPSFKEVSTSKAIFAFDEWGWGKNRGRGLSYALNRKNMIRQFDNKSWFADIIKDNFEFKTTSGNFIDYFIYSNGKLIGYEKNKKIEYLYAHFQKRSMKNKVIEYNLPIYITPNIMSSEKKYEPNEFNQWAKDQKHRRIKQIKSNLNYSYLKRRLKFIKTEK